MRLKISKSKNTISYSVIKSVYDLKGKETSRTVKKIGTHQELLNQGHLDPLAYARDLVLQMNENEEVDLVVNFKKNQRLDFNVDRRVNLGYLFLESIYFDLKLDELCQKITLKEKLDFNLSDVLQALLCTKILNPLSKYSSFEHTKRYVEPKNYTNHELGITLELIIKYSDEIQSLLYKKTREILNINSDLLYYDCSIYDFEFDSYNTVEKYETKLGILLDGNQTPLAIGVSTKNNIIKASLQSLENKLKVDYKNSKYVIFNDNKVYHSPTKKYKMLGKRKYIFNHHYNELSKENKAYVKSASSWKKLGTSDKMLFNLYDEINKFKERNNHMDYKEHYPLSHDVFYKERFIYNQKNNAQERIVVIFSMQSIDFMLTNERRQYRVFNTKLSMNKKDSKAVYKNLNGKKIVFKQISKRFEEMEFFRGLTIITTNFDEDVKELYKIVSERASLKNYFKTMKHEYKNSLTGLDKEGLVESHFIVSYIALVIMNILEIKVNQNNHDHKSRYFQSKTIIDKIKSMDFIILKNNFYIPLYKRNILSDRLQEVFRFGLDNEIYEASDINKIIRSIRIKNS